MASLKVLNFQVIFPGNWFACFEEPALAVKFKVIHEARFEPRSGHQFLRLQFFVVLLNSSRDIL
jgi:hypothetical protein